MTSTATTLQQHGQDRETSPVLSKKKAPASGALYLQTARCV
jgi:hypothetical protein